MYSPDSCTHVYLTRDKPLDRVMAHISSSSFCDVYCLPGNILATRGPHCLLPLLKGTQTGSSFHWGERLTHEHFECFDENTFIIIG